jgi:uncharacterized membrane protein YhdT
VTEKLIHILPNALTVVLITLAAIGVFSWSWWFLTPTLLYLSGWVIAAGGGEALAGIAEAIGDISFD